MTDFIYTAGEQITLVAF